MTSKWILLLALLALPICAAADEKEEKQPIPNEATRIFKIQHADVHSVWTVLQVFNATVRYDRGLGVISASGSKETVAAIGEAIENLDVPEAATGNMELTFHILLASKQPPPADARPLPEHLKDVSAQLRKVFGYGVVRPLDTSLIRARNESGFDTSGVLTGPGTTGNYRLRAHRVGAVAAGDATTVRIDKLVFSGTMEYPHGQGFSISTDIDVRAGQKAVVGKAGVTGEGDHLILVVMARLM